jgi:hypothetical protein
MPLFSTKRVRRVAERRVVGRLELRCLRLGGGGERDLGVELEALGGASP